MAQFGAILVPDTKEYRNNRHGNGFVEMQLEFPFYFGKLPDGLTTSMLRVRVYLSAAPPPVIFERSEHGRVS